MVDNFANQILDATRERLGEFGITFKLEREEPGESIYAVVVMSREGQRQRYSAMVKESMTFNTVTRGAHGSVLKTPYPPLILGNHIHRRSASAFRDAGIQFVDVLGNAFITFGNVFVEVQGRTDPTFRPSYNYKHILRRRQPANIFSPRRSQVILALLTWPELSTAKVRQIANTAGVSTGQAHDALTQLQEAGFLVPVSKRLDRVDELLDLWTAAYPTGLGQRLEIAKYHGDPSLPISGMVPEQPFFLSSESATGCGVVRPATLTVYLDHLDLTLPVRNQWNTSPDQFPNIFVRQKFWTSPHADEERASAEGKNAPWPLVYADLMVARDARLSEVARYWRIRFARPDQV